MSGGRLLFKHGANSVVLMIVAVMNVVFLGMERPPRDE